ncbi:MAG: hypothetical protein WC980_00465 [Candidatus Brocadiia bacterium]
MKKVIAGLVLAVVILVPSMAQAEFIKVKGLGWDDQLTGNIQLSDSVLAGTKLDLKNDLGIKSSAIVGELEFKVKPPIFKTIVVSYGTGSFSGRRIIGRDVNFGGKTFTASDTIKTSMDATVGSLMVQWEFAPASLLSAFPSLNSGEFGLLLGANYLGFDTKVSSGTTGVNTSEKANIPIPVIGGFMEVGFMERFKFAMTATLFNLKSAKIGPNQVSASYANLSFDVKMNVYKNIPIGLGYRSTSLNADLKGGSTFSTDLAMKGFYLVTSYGF